MERVAPRIGTRIDAQLKRGLG
ncbi:hypothetical protein CCACVL1_07928 [Corchorus capsularis]|uniref:Uncharacterized protein n=1 Tax=Corchorus capsularis TaxID=210143 RepID=A0A1R3J397_COCAP|nr:hypothetical protein CCACVL1_07928 [Corchorus capsularis]